MRLLTRDNTGKISLTEFPYDKTPSYAILSHTWGEEEVTFKDITNGTAENKLGHEKINFCAEQATRDGWKYFWVDTCCIDKSSSAELQRSINSMFRWYRDAAVCYVYLADVRGLSSRDSTTVLSWEAAFRASRWFRRGWTLQELIAPKSVEFFSNDGIHIGNKSTLEQTIYEITKIPVEALRDGQDLSKFTVDERMLWMEGRATTEEEDMAYSLLGVLDVYMPLLYSEGKDNALRRLKEEVNKKAPPKPSVLIPFSRDPDFVNRGDILNEINIRCSEPAGRVALVGLGGVGKSQLAIEAAYRITETRNKIWVFWVYAATRARVEEGFKTIADTVEVPGRDQPTADIPLLIHNWLNNERNGQWMIVLDSADDHEVFYGAKEGSSVRPLASYLPQSRNGSIIVTTRDKDLASRLTGTRKYVIEVGPMTSEEGLALLEKKLGSRANIAAATDLVKTLDCVPLAISQAAAYIQARESRSSVERYVAAFRGSEHKKMRLLEHDSGDLRRDGGASNAILITWQMSFDHIRNKRPSAAKLLSLMSFFDRQGIPESVLRSRKEVNYTGALITYDETADSGASSDTASDDGAVDDTESTSGSFDDDVAMLNDYCLVRVNEEGDHFDMHRLVQLATRKWLAVFGQEETFKKQYVERLAASFPTWQYENWTTCQKLFTHVELVLGYRLPEQAAKEWAILLYRGAWYALLQGGYTVAETMASEARKACMKDLGKEDHTTLACTGLLANVFRATRQWRKAESLEVEVLNILRNKCGDSHRDTWTGMANLALTYKEQGRWKEAEDLQSQVVEARRSEFGPDHPDTLLSMSSLASTLWSQGRWGEAEKIFMQVIESGKTNHRADHPETLTSISYLAWTYVCQGRLVEAEKLEIRVVEARKSKLGADHLDTLLAMRSLAMTYALQDRWDEAEKLMVQVVGTHKHKFGTDHPDTLRAMEILAYIIDRKGLKHPGTLTTMENNLLEEWAHRG